MPTLRELFAQIPGGRVVVPASSEESTFDWQTSGESSAIDAKLLEDGDFRAIPVPALGVSGFTDFLDGTQKSWRVAYLGLLPASLAWISAGRLRRVDREILAPAPDEVFTRLMLVVPAGASLPFDLGNGIDLVSVMPDPSKGPAGFGDALRQTIERQRTEAEVSLAASWEGNGGQWLMVDGGIGEFVQRSAVGAQLVGVVKSHQRQYVASQDRVEVLLSLKAGERTTAFLRPATSVQGAEAISFYMKLQDRSHEGPFFGLIRVELPNRPEMAEVLDTVAGWLLAERAPLSLPDSRFDRLLYPIHLVEEHLKARRPSDAWVRGILGI